MRDERRWSVSPSPDAFCKAVVELLSDDDRSTQTTLLLMNSSPGTDLGKRERDDRVVRKTVMTADDGRGTNKVNAPEGSE